MVDEWYYCYSAQHAVRLLALLRVSGDPVGGNDPTVMVQLIRRENDFRRSISGHANPDHLADELVTAVEDRDIDSKYLEVAETHS